MRKDNRTISLDQFWCVQTSLWWKISSDNKTTSSSIYCSRWACVCSLEIIIKLTLCDCARPHIFDASIRLLLCGGQSVFAIAISLEHVWQKLFFHIKPHKNVYEGVLLSNWFYMRTCTPLHHIINTIIKFNISQLTWEMRVCNRTTIKKKEFSFQFPNFVAEVFIWAPKFFLNKTLLHFSLWCLGTKHSSFLNADLSIIININWIGVDGLTSTPMPFIRKIMKFLSCFFFSIRFYGSGLFCLPIFFVCHRLDLIVPLFEKYSSN